MDIQTLKNLSLSESEKKEIIWAILGGGQILNKDITINNFSNEYKDLVKSNYSDKYYESNVLSLKHFESYFSGTMKLRMISQREAEKFLESIKKRAPKGYRVYYRNLKAAFNKALDWGYISENPFSKIKLPKRQFNKPEFITEKELDMIMKRIESKAFKNGCPINKRKSLLIIGDVIKTAFYTGMRLSEVNNLRWENVSISKKMIIVGGNNFTTKSRKQRVIPLENNVIEIFNMRNQTSKNKNDFVYSINGRRIFSNDYISKTFKKICREVGIDEMIRFHSLRHSFASNLAQRGVSPFQLKELLGHSSVSTTERYSHLNIDSLREAINKFN